MRSATDSVRQLGHLNSYDLAGNHYVHPTVSSIYCNMLMGDRRKVVWGVPIVFTGSDNCRNIYIIEHNRDVMKQNEQALFLIYQS